MRMLLLMTLIIFASSASAGLYKWVDDEGNVHYSQKRPSNKQFKRIKPPAPAPDNAKSLYQLDNSANKSDKTIQKETDKNTKLRTENCEQAKKNLSAYQVSRRVRNDKGEVIRLDDKTRESQIKNAKLHITEYCK